MSVRWYDDICVTSMMNAVEFRRGLEGSHWNKPCQLLYIENNLGGKNIKEVNFKNYINGE